MSANSPEPAANSGQGTRMSVESIGSYRIIRKLGSGGMGDVYRAHDPRLARDVAIKVLPESLANNRSRLVRLEREARLLAAVQHPNIATIYGVEQGALVMELVEGEELRCPVPLDTALAYARQIINALETAHEKGIIHRDLKPANIKITDDGVVKLLDFGLAKAVEPARQPVEIDPSLLPTASMDTTPEGFICGTAAYMAPEQTRSRSVDKRVDIWAFGVVLYEMLSGRRPFASGATIAETIGAVISQAPDWSALPEDTPPHIRQLIEYCLRKDPKHRLRDIGDARLLIEKPVRAPAPKLASRRLLSARVLGIAGAAIAAILLALWLIPRSTTSGQPLIRLNADLGPDAISSERTLIALAPNENRIAWLAKGPTGSPQIATRTFDQEKATLLPGTEGAVDPFFSPDGQWIGYFAGGQMKKIPVRGGTPVTLGNFRNTRGAVWGKDHAIIVSGSSTGGLSRVPDTGGQPEQITDPQTSGFRTHRWPQILPNGKHILLTANKAGVRFDSAVIELFDMQNRRTTPVYSGGYFGRYLPTGHMIYVQHGSLFAVRMDPDKLEPKGTPVRLLEDVAADEARGAGRFEFNSSGTLVYFSGHVESIAYPVISIDAAGETWPLLPALGLYQSPALSRDGRLAVAVGAAGAADLHVWDPRSETLTRLTFTADRNFMPVWAPDGNHIAYVSNHQSEWSLFWIRADGTGQPHKLLDSLSPVYASSFTPDGRYLLYSQELTATGRDIWLLPIDTTDPGNPKPGSPESIVHTTGFESSPVISPDGKWLAYTSDESGHSEVYVQAFPRASGRWQISSGEGIFPKWSPAGGQIFFETREGRIMVADFRVNGAAFVSGKPRQWTQVRARAGRSTQNYDVSTDGKRVVTFPRSDDPETAGSSVHVTFLLNFFDEVKRRLPN